MSAITFDYNENTIQELNAFEIDFVNGGWTWRGLGGAALAGGVTGGLGGAAAGAAIGGVGAIPGAVTGAVGGALLGALGYLIVDAVSEA